MIGARRILAPEDLYPGMRQPAARAPEVCCRSTVALDGKRYRCGVEVYGADCAHGGAHDAFAVHGDGGAVRW